MQTESPVTVMDTNQVRRRATEEVRPTRIAVAGPAAPRSRVHVEQEPGLSLQREEGLRREPPVEIVEERLESALLRVPDGTVTDRRERASRKAVLSSKPSVGSCAGVTDATGASRTTTARSSGYR